MPIEFRRKPGLVVYFAVGDPDLETSRRIALAALDAGADVLELGVPFSDPVADGPVNQRAAERALRHGTCLADVLQLARILRRERPQAGLVIFSYLNPILRMGLEGFATAAAAAGVDGVLIVDLIVEEAGEHRNVLARHGLKTIFLAAPTSPDDRLTQIARASQGFVYAISRVGITGTQQEMAAGARELVQRIRRFTDLPVALGFGISSPAHVAAAAEFVDAVVVGSAIVSIIENSAPEEAAASVSRFVSSLRSAAGEGNRGLA